MNKITKINNNWYKELIADLKKLEFTGIVLTKWNIGKRILADELKFQKAEYGSRQIETLAKDLEIGTRDIYQCIQFAKKYPNSATPLQNHSWHYVANKLLPEPRTSQQEIQENKLALFVPKGKFRTVVIDPPWPVQKIERDVRPKQTKQLDYPVMTIDNIKELDIDKYAFKDSHIYLWTTHKYLPDALEIFEQWGVNYQCVLTWVKNVGFTPFSWMYSTELILFGRKGNLDLLKKGKRLDFKAKVQGHSIKPDEFYELVKQVSPSPRCDIFGRRDIKGFKQISNGI